jgi:hypothetical protein
VNRLSNFFLCLAGILPLIVVSNPSIAQTDSITTTKRGYATSTGWAYQTADMMVGLDDNAVVNNVIGRAFAFFDIPSQYQGRGVLSATVKVKVKASPTWNSKLTSVRLYDLGNFSWNDFSQLPLYAVYDSLGTGTLRASQTKADALAFSVSASLIQSKSEIGFSFRANPEDPSGTIYDDSNFIYLNDPILFVEFLAAPKANSATSITSSGFTANWNSVSAASGYRLDVSTSSTFNSYVSGYQNFNVANATSRSVTGLNSSTTYYYRIRAYISGGPSDNSNTISVTTLPNAPSTPTANAATSITNTSFTANWSTTSGATTYRVDVSTSSQFSSYVTGYQDLNVGNVTSRSVIGLVASTTHYYRVRATNAGGTSANSNTITVTTLPNAPSTPTANAATNVTSSSFRANWNSVSGAAGYRLDVSTSSTFSSFLSGYHDLDVGNVTNKTVTGLNANTVYYYRLRAYNAGGTSGNSNTMSLNTVTSVEAVASGIPINWALSQNYPNPFNPATTIEFSVAKETRVLLSIFNSLGANIETLVDQNLAPGRYRTIWIPRNLPSGAYYCSFRTSEYTETRKLLLLR